MMSRNQRFEWYSHFKRGQDSADDDPQSGRASTTDGDLVNQVRSFVHANGRLIIGEL